MTLPEVMLWQALKANSAGVKFRRQHPVGPYVADFYCAEARLVIEVDGIAHDRGDRPARDAARTAYLETKGCRVLRIAASDILKNASEVAASVVQSARPLRQSLRDCHLPTSGEDS
jgi:very-short-patch-repair endonuclease